MRGKNIRQRGRDDPYRRCGHDCNFRMSTTTRTQEKNDQDEEQTNFGNTLIYLAGMEKTCTGPYSYTSWAEARSNCSVIL